MEEVIIKNTEEREKRKRGLEYVHDNKMIERKNENENSMENNKKIRYFLFF